MSDLALQYSHSGSRYLLGYGPDFFGIWDRTVPGGAVERFPRDDAGWARAWTRFVELEPEHVAVGLVGGAPAPTPARPLANGRRPVEWWWWLLPFLFALVGGLIAWSRLRGRDPRAARSVLLVGIGTTLLNVVWFVSSGGRF